MQTVEMTSESVRAAAALIPEGVPVFMLNLLRYRERADYGDRAGMAPCSGHEAYFQRYASAFNRVPSADEITVLFVGPVHANVVAPPDERWDDMVIVEYPSFAVFRRIVEYPMYEAEAAFHRTAALADSRLTATTRMAMPG